VPSDKRQRQRENAAARAAAMRAAHQRRANRRKAIGGGLAVVAVAGIIALLVAESTGGGTKKSATPPGATTTVAAAAAPPLAPPVKGGQSIPGPTPCPKEDGSSPRASHFSQAPPSCVDLNKQYTATFDTTQGKIVVALDTQHTAGTVNNFVVLARYHYYDGSSFDRIDKSIDIIQGGSPSTQTIADPGPGYTINDEPGNKFSKDSTGKLHGPYTYAPGDLVMARTAEPKSASAQFFFVAGPAASSLNADGSYVVFGHVTQGLGVLQNIETNLYEACPASDQTCLGGAPSKVVLVNSVTISTT
jgi:cyclophilin family peptidyl-prolyl cis-trans isomerase